LQAAGIDENTNAVDGYEPSTAFNKKILKFISS